jgi:lipopolysaccharide biosynthesis glycosyltransferase
MREERRAVRPDILDNARIIHFLSAEKPWSTPEAVHPWLLEKYERFAWSAAK